MIKIKKEDTIIDVLNKISEEKSDKIILDFPFGHPILHNHLYLKIIKTKARNKQLAIISNDKTAKKIAKLLGIKFIKSKNSQVKEIKKYNEILKENYSFLEYAKFEIKNFFNKFSGNIKNNKKINKIYYLKNKYNSSQKNITAYLILLLVVMFIIFFYIYYFAINKTYITLYPEIKVNIKSRNFNFIENMKKQKYPLNNQIELNRITKNLSLSKTFTTSGIKQDEKNIAKGKVIFYNYLKEKVYLLKNTTLETKDGIQFYTKSDITIPAASDNNIPGTKEEIVYGKIKLMNGEYSGEKSNIKKDIPLIISKLSKENKTKIFAKSISNFKGGSNKFIKFLKKEDIENAKKILIEDLKLKGRNAIKNELKLINKNNTIDLEILPIENIFKYKDLKINIPKHLKEGDEINNFTLKGEITSYSFIYNKNIVLSILKKVINEDIINQQEKIISIDDKSLRISYIIKRNDLRKNDKGKYEYIKNFNSDLKVKATVEIEYNTSKKFHKTSSFITEKLKHLIAGKTIEKAEKILINQSDINNVKITVKPFFLKNISKIINNIEISIEE